jgi:hypothetical protein
MVGSFARSHDDFVGPDLSGLYQSSVGKELSFSANLQFLLYPGD